MKIINTYEIDSFKLRIPIEKIQIVSNDLGQKIETIRCNADTSEILSEETKVNNKVLISENGIKTTYQIEHTFNNSKDKQKLEYFLTIKITSKHLRKRYFEGITNDNIELVYNSIINQNVVCIEFKEFLKQSLVDIDFKKDHHNKDYLELIKRVSNFTIPKKEYNQGIQKFEKKYNQGFQFSSRKYATITSPYIKYYNKEKQTLQTENKGGMKEFFNEFIPELRPLMKDLYRVEFTIKNKRMFDGFGIGNTLQDVLNLKSEVKQGIAKDIFSKHTERNTMKIPNIKASLTPRQKIHIGIKDLAIKQGMTINQIDDYFKQLNLGYRPHKNLMDDIQNLNFFNDDNYIKQQLQTNENLEKLYLEIGL